jgi:hypothetical protein
VAVATYDLGDAVTLTTTVVDTDGTATNTTMVLTLTAPDGTSSTPSISNPTTGTYTAVVTPDQVGTWLFNWAGTGAVVVADSGQFTVQNPAAPAYASLTDLKASLTLTAADRDDRLTRVLLSSSRAIEKSCGDRKFWLDPAASARTFNVGRRLVDTPQGQQLFIDDIGSTLGLTVEVGSGIAFTTVTDYITGPDNALARGWPINWLLRPGRRFTGSSIDQIRVTARWGFPAIPDDIAEATLILANRRYKRKESPEGVLGSAEWGLVRVSRVDPDVLDLISPYLLEGVG